MQIGPKGLSLISQPATAGISSSRRFTSERITRDFACPRSPRKMMSCPERMAFSRWGTTVSSKPTMPGRWSASPLRMRSIGFLAATSPALLDRLFESGPDSFSGPPHPLARQEARYLVPGEARYHRASGLRVHYNPHLRLDHTTDPGGEYSRRAQRLQRRLAVPL